MHITRESLLNQEHLPLWFGNIKVYVDYEEVNHVIELHTGKEGWVKRYVAKGDWKNCFNNDFTLKTEVLHGNVTVQMKDMTLISLHRRQHGPYKLGNFDTLLDGKLLENVVELNPLEGWVVVFNEEPKILYGKVEIILKETE